MSDNPHDAEEAMRPATDLVRPHGVPLTIRPDFQALLDLLGQWWNDQQGHEPNLGDLAERIVEATEDYGTVREQGRQDGIVDGRRGYVEVTADQSRPVPRASVVGSIDREALDAEILAWYTAQRPDLDLADLGDRIAGLMPSRGPVLDARDVADCVWVATRAPRSHCEAAADQIVALAARLETRS